jgi:hypothetical protein
MSYSGIMRASGARNPSSILGIPTEFLKQFLLIPLTYKDFLHIVVRRLQCSFSSLKFYTQAERRTTKCLNQRRDNASHAGPTAR